MAIKVHAKAQNRRRERSKVLLKVIVNHEPAIRKITNLRKEVASKVASLQAQDKKLKEDQVVKMQERDRAVEEARVLYRESSEY